MAIVPLGKIGYEAVPDEFPEMRKLIDVYNENFRWLDALLNKGGLDRDNISDKFIELQNVANPFSFRANGNYHTNALGAGSLTSAPIQANRLFAMPFPVPVTQKFDRIAVNITMGATGVCRLGIYADNGRTYPGTLILNAGEINTGTNGGQQFTVSQTLHAGIYWLACLFNATPSISNVPAGAVVHLGRSLSQIAGEAQSGWTILSFPYGNLPSPFPTMASGMMGSTPAIFLRKFA